METCWRQAEVKYKEDITQELVLSEQQLTSNFYGRIVLKNCGVEHFKRKDKTWHEKEHKAARKRKLLEEIFEEREDIGKQNKKAKLKDKHKFTMLAPEMAVLGFTASGNHTADSEGVRSEKKSLISPRPFSMRRKLFFERAGLALSRVRYLRVVYLFATPSFQFASYLIRVR